MFALALALWATRAAAQTSDNLLLVINDNSPASVDVGNYYGRARGIALDHIVHIKAPTTDGIQRYDYEHSIEAPIGTWIAARSLQDDILFIVLTKGVPLRISGTEGRDATTASVDSELTLLYRKLMGIQTPLAGRIPNPYYLGDKPATDAKPFTRHTGDIYLVTRLDGFTVDDVKKLVDRGLRPARDGRIVLDERGTGLDAGGDDWLLEARKRLAEAGAGDRVVMEETRALAVTPDPVFGYYSWGSNDRSNRLRRFGFSFVPGAIGGMYVSTDGRTFNEPPADWIPSGPDGGPGFGGSFQSLSGDLIRDGITGVSGHVAEPYLDATIRPQVLFPAYLSGLNLAESFYLAMPFLSWQTVVVGDPLCAPFRAKALTADEISKGIDPTTDLPALFSQRRLALLTRTGLNAEAIKLVLKADAHLSQGNPADVEALLVMASQLDAKLTMVDFRLATMYEQRGDYAKAVERYQRVLVNEPQNVVALNNAAYAMAEHLDKAQDALPLAEHAATLSSSPVVLDTLGWVRHLLGDERGAAAMIERAALARDNGVILFHAAVVHAALGDKVRARGELDAAVKLDPKIADKPEAKALRAAVSGSGG